jgi:hypothetical protein
MRVINGEQFLAPVTHLPLRGEKILGRGFVAELGIRGNVAQTINRAGVLLRVSANQSTTFSRSHFASMSNHCVKVFAKQPDGWHFQS